MINPMIMRNVLCALSFAFFIGCGRRDNPNIPTKPIIGKCATPGYATDLFVNGNYAYVADGQAGLVIIDIIDSLRILGMCDIEGYAQGVVVKDSFTYISGGEQELVIIDVSKPNTPTIKQSITNQVLDYGYDICVFSKDTSLFAFISCKDKSRTFDVTNVEVAPYEIISARYKTSGDARGVYFNSNFVYIADEQMGLHIIDVTDPYNPDSIGWCDTPGRANDVFVLGNYAYVADGSMGLQIIDISVPKEPKLVGNYNTSGYAMKVFVYDNYAYVADRKNGLLIIDVSNPSSPFIVGKCNTPYANSVYVTENYVYLADRDEGLVVIKK